MFRVSQDTPAYYLTSVTKDRLPVFRSDSINTITCLALDEARRSGDFQIFAYVIMPDHLHLITSCHLKVPETLRFVNGITAHRIITYLKQSGYDISLQKLRRESGARQHKYSLWDHHPNARLLTNESSLMQRINYTHQNPVKLGLVDRAEDYKWSSSRQWRGCPLGDELLIVDIKDIEWRKA